MNKKFYRFALPLLLAAAGTVLPSCVDRDYVIDDVNLQVSLAPGGIEIPLAVIEKHPLSEFVKDREDDNIVLHDGYYAIEAKDDEQFSVSGEKIVAAVLAAGLLGSGGAPALPQEPPLEDHIFHAGSMNPIGFAEMIQGFEELTSASDMAPPVIELAITNPTEVTLLLYMTLMPHDGQGVQLTSTEIEIARIAPAVGGIPVTSYFLIAEQGVLPPDDGHDYEIINPEKFEQLLTTIPHTIHNDFRLGVAYGNAPDVDIEREYEFVFDTAVLFPLRFGEGMNLAIELTEERLNATFAQLAEAGVKAQEVDMHIEFETTLELKVDGIEAELSDSDGNPVPGLTLTTVGGLEGPSPSAEGTTTSTVSFDLAVPDGGDFAAFSTIDRLTLYLPLEDTAAPGERIGFSPDDYFRGRVWLSIPEGVSVDLKKLFEK